MAETNVVLPSGLAGRIRSMRGKDFRALSDRRAVQSGEAIGRVLEDCWLETTDPGPYAKLSWPDVFLGDRFACLIELRRVTYREPDHLYAFDVQCKDRGCRAKIKWQLDLADMTVKRASAETLDALKQGRNRFLAEVADKRFWFKLLTGKDQERQRRLASQVRSASVETGPVESQSIVISLASRILEVEGVAEMRSTELVEYLEDFELPDLRDLLAAFDDVDFGVETEIEVECRDCGMVQGVELPFDRGFFLPEKRKQTSSPSAGRRTTTGA